MLPSTMSKRPMKFDMKSDLPQGEAMATDDSGLRIQMFRVPQERPPEWATITYLSPEDMGSLMRTMSNAR